MKSLFFGLLSLLLIGSANNLRAQTAKPPAPGSPDAPTLVRDYFGPAAEIVGGTGALTGDFNGDTFQDIAVLVRAKGKRGDLKTGVQFVDLKPVATQRLKDLPGTVFAENFSLAVIQGSSAGLKQATDTKKILLYGFNWAGWNGPETGKLIVLEKAKQKRDKIGYVQISPENYVRLPAGVKGDAIIVPTEAGINVTLYYNGTNYLLYFDPDDTP